MAAGDTEEAYPNCGWPIHLIDDLETATSELWFELPFRYAVGGYDVADIKAGIDNALSGRSDEPTYVCILLGTNDVAASHGWPIAEETWKTNYRYILDAIHTKWADAEIYLGNCYREGYEAALNILQGWINDLIAEQTYYHLGADAWPIFNGHPELLVDGLHPNHDGHVALATAWEAVLHP